MSMAVRKSIFTVLKRVEIVIICMKYSRDCNEAKIFSELKHFNVLVRAYWGDGKMAVLAYAVP